MKKYLFPAIAIAIGGIVSCGKDYNPNGVNPDKNNDIATLIAALAPQPKTVTINAATGGSFNGNSGTRFVFAPNSFQTSTGAIVTGDVQVRVTEFLKKADILYSGVLPISDGEPLLSGGEMLVEATQGGQDVQMAPGKPFKANMPMQGTKANGMQLFIAEKNQGVVNWKPVDTAVGGFVFTDGDTIGISSIKVNTYCNADRFMASPDYQDFTITINMNGQTYLKDSMKLYTVYDEYNGVWPNQGYNAVGNDYRENHVPNIPVHFVAIIQSKGKFYGGITGATPSNGGKYIIDMAETTPVAFKTKLMDL